MTQFNERFVNCFSSFLAEAMDSIIAAQKQKNKYFFSRLFSHVILLPFRMFVILYRPVHSTGFFVCASKLTCISLVKCNTLYDKCLRLEIMQLLYNFTT